MKKQVVVMSGADVAAMRNTYKEAQSAYYQAKVGALEFAVAEMERTHQVYSLNELSTLTGLSPMEISVQLSGICKAGQEAGVYQKRIRHSRRMTERKFIEILPTGELDTQSIMTVRKWERTYHIPENEGVRR